MPRRTAKQIKLEKRWAATLAGALVAAVLVALTLAFPAAGDWVFGLLGRGNVQVPVVAGASDIPVAVHVIDVGQGDAVLLEDHGEFALLDAGPPEAQDRLVRYLELAGVERLRYLVMSHPHADHYGGMEKVVARFPVEVALLPDFELAPYPTAQSFVNLLAALLDAKVEAVTAREGTEWPLGEGSLRVVHGGLETGDEYNLISLGVLFEGGGLRFLNTGDGEKANERAMLDAGADVAAGLFLAGHHGSSTSNSERFLQAVRPGMVVVSCAEGNSYGHPHRSALEGFAAVGATVARTDESGSVVVKPDGQGGLVYGVERGRAEAAA